MVGSKTAVGGAPQAAPASQPPRSGRSARLLVSSTWRSTCYALGEQVPQVRLLKRGGGRRYYRPEDVDLLRQIRSLLYEEGYTIKGAQKLLKSQRRAAPIDGEEAAAEAAAAPADTRPRPRPELVPEEVRHRLIELREELVAVLEAREAAG